MSTSLLLEIWLQNYNLDLCQCSISRLGMNSKTLTWLEVKSFRLVKGFSDCLPLCDWNWLKHLLIILLVQIIHQTHLCCLKCSWTCLGCIWWIDIELLRRLGNHRKAYWSGDTEQGVFRRNKLGLSCAKLRASLNLSGFD